MSDNNFQNFINMELPKRIGTEDDPTTVPAGSIPVSTGIGLTTEFLLPGDVPGLDTGGLSAYEVAVENGFEGNEVQWLESLVGPVGMSAYDSAVSEGYGGTLGEWLKTLVGPQGEKGEDGVSGPALNILGSVTLTEFYESIYEESNWVLGDTWIVRGALDTVFKIWGPPSAERPEGDWIDSGDMRGPAGTGLIIRGEWTLDKLPLIDNTPGDTYGWQNGLYTWMLTAGTEDIPENYKWVQIVPEGPEGPQGPIGNAGERGVQGIPGEKGEDYAPFKIVGKLESPSDLPATDEALESEAYAVKVNNVNHLFIFVNATNVWKDLGPLQGEKGDKGDPGIQGIQGIQGISAYQVAVDKGFSGNEEGWLDSLHGRNVKVSGSYPDITTLLEAGVTLIEGDAYSVTETNRLYFVKKSPVMSMTDLIDLGEFKGDKGDKGDPGEQGVQGIQGISAYQVAVDKGFSGSEQDWLDSLHGQNVKISGSYPDTTALLAAGATLIEGDAYSVTETNRLYFVKKSPTVSMTDLIDLGEFKGDKGDKGEPGLRGDKGDHGDPIVITGSLPSLTDIKALPSPEEQDAYFALDDLHLYIYVSGRWVDCGSHKGDKGDQGDQGIQGIQGERGLRGIKGDQGIQGIKGDKGDLGIPIRIKGNRSDYAAIRQIRSPKEWDAYVALDSLKIYVFAEGDWVDAGSHKGDKGDQGPQGIQGIKGDKGDYGNPLRVKGALPSLTQILAIVDPMEEDGYVALDSLKLYMFLSGEWTDMGSYKGDKGDKGDPGERGETGATGKQGNPINILGSRANLAAIRAVVEPAEKDAYVALDNRHIYMYLSDTWVDLGTHTGDRGIQGPTGPKGDPGERGERGLTGADGRDFEVIDIVESIADLPTANASNRNKAVVVRDGNVYFNLRGNAWENMGRVGVQGDKGDHGNSLTIVGELVGVESLPNLRTDNEIKSGDAYLVLIAGDPETGVLDKKLLYVANRTTDSWDGPFDIQGPQGETGPQGPQGIRGEVGEGIKIIGNYLLLDDLLADRPTANLGDAFLVGETNDKSMYVWTTDDSPERVEGYRYIGKVTIGPKGDPGERGETGPQGIRGSQGFRGEKGSRWIILPPSKPIPDETVGIPDDWCIDQAGKVWYRDYVGWKPFLQLFDVPVTEVDAEDSDKKMVRSDFGWVELPVDEINEPIDNVQYVRIKGESDLTPKWKPIAVNEELIEDVLEDVDNVPQARIRGEWVNTVPSPTELEPSETFLLKGDGSGWVASDVFEDAPKDDKFYLKGPDGWIPTERFVEVKDNKNYLRTKGSWVEYKPFEDTTSTEIPMARIKGSWVETSPFVDAPTDDQKTYGRKAGTWVTVISESPNDGKLYARQTDAEGLGGWRLVPVPAFTEDAPDNKNYLRSVGNWVEYKPLVEPPIDANKVYGRRTTVGGTSSWIEIDTDKSFDTYSLTITTVSGNVTITPVDQQCYTININVQRSITLRDGPTGRSCMVVLVLTGGNIVPTFPGTKIKMAEGRDLTLHPTKTVVTAFWDGTEWIIAKGLGY